MRRVKLSDCCEIVSGATPSRAADAYWNGNINWFTPKDLSKLDSKYVGESPEKITKLESPVKSPLLRSGLHLKSGLGGFLSGA